MRPMPRRNSSLARHGRTANGGVSGHRAWSYEPLAAKVPEITVLFWVIKVLTTGAVLPGHLPELIAAIKPAVIIAQKRQSGNLLDNASAENVRRQVTRLKSSPPVVQKSYAGKQIYIVGGVYDLATGKIALI